MEAFLDIHCCSCAFFHPPLVVLITTLGVLRYHTSNCRAVDRRDVTRHKLLHTPPIDLFVRRASFFRQRMSYCKSSTTGELPRSSPQKSLLYCSFNGTALTKTPECAQQHSVTLFNVLRFFAFLRATHNLPRYPNSSPSCRLRHYRKAVTGALF
jgi:hypothetical protein